MFDPECHASVVYTETTIGELKTDFNSFKDDIYPKINKTAESVARIEGFMAGIELRLNK